MSPREIIYYSFYFICFALAITGQIAFSGNSHTPPGGFVVELLILPIGAIVWLIDAVRYKSTKVHKVGMTMNGLVMLCILIPALV
jgi:hypothetical protein